MPTIYECQDCGANSQIPVCTVCFGRNTKEIRLIPETTYKCGDLFIHDEIGEPFVLAQVVSGGAALVGLHDGNRWACPFGVADVKEITQAEFDEISEVTPRNKEQHFIPEDKPFTIKKHYTKITEY